MLRRRFFLLLTAAVALIAGIPPGAEARDAQPGKETVAVLKTTQGTVVLRFFPDKAPEHVKNFLHHSKSGVYKKTYFHRVCKDFMAQGGDPNTKDEDPSNDGQGGWSYKKKGTFLKAEFNDTPHLRGVLSMARGGQNPDSAGSQFFIMVRDWAEMDGKYTVFGRVVRGMDAVDKIVAQPGKEIPVVGGVNPEQRQVIEDIAIEEWTTDDVYLAEAAQYGADNCLRKPLAVLETGRGEIGISFFGDKAPEHVRNFLHHVRGGLYEGTSFHLVVPGSEIHGGDPNTKNADPADDGQGGHSYKGEGAFLKAEFNDVKHVRGIVSMDLGEGPDSAGSRFRILLKDRPDLDGNRTAFGRMIFGLEAADEISKQPGTGVPGAEGVIPAERQVVKKTRVDYVTPAQLLAAPYEAERRRVIEALKLPKGKQHVAIIETTQGTITLKFFPEKAPMHVHNFLSFCRSGFYEGTYFHRVFPGFMIQGGNPNTKDDDPANDGAGGHSYLGEKTFLQAEFNDVNHVRGILSMARLETPDTAGSQFFIMVAANAGLNGKYSAFGKVVSGLSVVDKIVAEPGEPLPAGGVNPARHQVIKKATVEVWTDQQVAQAERKKD